MAPTGVVSYLFFSFLVVSGNADQLTINTLVDALLLAVNEGLQLAGDSSVSIPDFKETFKISIIKGGITATNGVLSDLSTLQRTGDAVLDLDDTSATLTISLDLSQMNLVYSDCTIWLAKETATDELSVTVGSNALSAQITIEVNGSSCQMILNYIKFSEIGDLDIAMADLNEIPYIASKIANWILVNFQSEIEAPIESILERIVNEQLQNYDFCSLI